MAQITLEQSIASVVRYILDNDVEGSKAYFDEIPDSYYSPSIYFPVPYVEGQQVTLRSYLNTITFVAWFQARTDWEAEARAAKVGDALMLDRLHIPILNKDGTETGQSIAVDQPQQRKIEEGIVSLTITAKDYFSEKKNDAPKASSISLAWGKAKEELREEDN